MTHCDCSSGVHPEEFQGGISGTAYGGLMIPIWKNTKPPTRIWEHFELPLAQMFKGNCSNPTILAFCKPNIIGKTKI